MKAACHIVSARNRLNTLHWVLFFRKDNTHWEYAACTVLSRVTVNVCAHAFMCGIVTDSLLVCKRLASMGIASEMLNNYRSCTLKLKGRFLKCFKKCSLNQDRVTKRYEHIFHAIAD